MTEIVKAEKVTALPDLMTPDEVAVMTRQSVATLKWLRYAGRGPKFGKLGRRVFYRRTDVEAWISAAFNEQHNDDE